MDACLGKGNRETGRLYRETGWLYRGHLYRG